MISRRAILALIKSIGTIAASGVALAKKQKKTKMVGHFSATT